MTARELDQRQERAWRSLHRIRQELLGHLGRNLTAQCDLSVSDYELLVALTEAPGRRMRSRDLGRRVGWERSRLSRQLQRMEKRGLLRREGCAEDARGIDVVVTPAGLTAIETAAPLQLEGVRHCFADVLTDHQLDTLADIADAISAHLAAEHGGDTSPSPRRDG